MNEIDYKFSEPSDSVAGDLTNFAIYYNNYLENMKLNNPEFVFTIGKIDYIFD